VEETILIPSGSDTLSAMLYRPEGEPKCGVVMCHPLFEERKSAHRVMVDAARALADAGCAVLRFDYRGCGDSSGDFAAFSCPDWRDDIARACRFLTDNTPVKRLGLLGLRLGASLALEAAATLETVDFAVLWEPILNGRRHFDHELRRKVVREMVTFGQSRVTRATLLKDLDDGKPVDLDGFAVTSRLFADIGAIDLTRASPAAQVGRALRRPASAGSVVPAVLNKVLVVQIAPTGAAPRELQGFKDAIQTAGADVDLVSAEEDPFWNLVGLVECPKLIEKTREWIRYQHQ